MLRSIASAMELQAMTGGCHSKSYTNFPEDLLGVFSMIFRFWWIFWAFCDCQTFQWWNTALKSSGDLVGRLKKAHFEFHQKKSRGTTYFELRTAKKGRFPSFLRVRFLDFGGIEGAVPPKFKNQGRNSLVMVFVRLIIFVFEKFPQEVTFCETTKSAFLSTESST